MKRLFCITAIVILISTFTEGQVSSYKAGEKVTYTIQYGFITAEKSCTQNYRQELQGWLKLCLKYWIFMKVISIRPPNCLLSQSETFVKGITEGITLYYSIIKRGLIQAFLQVILQGYILPHPGSRTFFPVSTFSVTTFSLLIQI